MSNPTAEEYRDVKITLNVESEDGTVIFHGEASSIKDLEENLIRKAEHKINEYMEHDGD